VRTIVVAVAVGAIAVVTLWVSGFAPNWLAPTLTAVVTAALVEEVVRRQRRIPLSEPVEFHVSIGDASYVHVPARGSEPSRTIPASGHTVRLVVTAVDRTVVLAALRVVVLERRPPRGVLSPHAGILPVRAYTALLDEDPPRLEPSGETSSVFSYTVGPDDPEAFEISVQTARWQVTWLLELDWVCGRRSGTVRVDLAGHPFSTVARPLKGLSWENVQESSGGTT
jgi:hypothetical protein